MRERRRQAPTDTNGAFRSPHCMSLIIPSQISITIGIKLCVSHAQPSCETIDFFTSCGILSETAPKHLRYARTREFYGTFIISKPPLSLCVIKIGFQSFSHVRTHHVQIPASLNSSSKRNRLSNFARCFRLSLTAQIPSLLCMPLLCSVMVNFTKTLTASQSIVSI